MGRAIFCKERTVVIVLWDVLHHRVVVHSEVDTSGVVSQAPSLAHELVSAHQLSTLVVQRLPLLLVCRRKRGDQG